MDRAEWERALGLYLPVAAAMIAGLLSGRRPRQFAASLLCVLWTVPSLLVVQRCNQYAGWWSFAPGSAAALRGMPLELFLGWTILWGLVPQLAIPRLGIARSALVMVAVDCMLMPLVSPAVQLRGSWLIGEAAAVAVVLLPALCLGQWTRNRTRLRARAWLQILTAGLLFLFLVPEIVFALRPGRGWDALFGLPPWVRQSGLQIVFLLALPGIAAVMEFAERGLGTPIPYDPPERLVTSSIYRYCANPMQLSCALAMVAWAALLENGWLLAAAALSVVYSAGVAEWDERQDLDRRFGQQWRGYRAAVRNWWPRWRPYHAGPAAVVYMARSCGPCGEARAWLEARRPLGLQIADAEALPVGSIRRMRYAPGDGSATVDGVRAMGRALEHLHLGWALAGAALRLPGVWWAIQLVMDASGLGPRTILPSECPTHSPSNSPSTFSMARGPFHRARFRAKRNVPL